jgi:hypothetical protein
MLSPYYFTSCKICNLNKYINGNNYVFGLNSNDFCNMGCNGGFLKQSHIYILLKGLPCMSHYNFNNIDVCYLNDTYNFKAKNVYKVTDSDMSNHEKELSIMNELYFNGPVSCGFIMYDDFENKSNFDNNGFYYSSNNIFTSSGPPGHAVSIVGWGKQKINTGEILPYWLCRNSFGNNYINDGFFKFLRGTNFCKIEDEVWAIEPFKYYDPPNY